MNVQRLSRTGLDAVQGLLPRSEFRWPVSTSSQATKDGIHLGREVHAVLGGAVAAVVRVILPTT